MRKISVFGHFGKGQTLLNGQTIKAKIITEELEALFGTCQVKRLDTSGRYKALLRMPAQVVYALLTSENIIMLPAYKGVRVLTPLLTFFNVFFKRKLHYVVIGGWLPKFLGNKPVLKLLLKKIDVIYTETTSMKNDLEALGFKNVKIMPNCKKYDSLAEITDKVSLPLKLCTYSRVMEGKGIEDAVKAVKSVNASYGKEVVTLDIIGPVFRGEENWFEKLKLEFDSSIRWIDGIDSSKSVEVLKDYFCLLFPTKFFTEGIPGSILDAYAAGLPVIYSKWQNWTDVIDDGTGIGYEFDNQLELVDAIKSVVNNLSIVNSKRGNCLAKVKDFSPKNVISVLISELR